MDTQASGDRDPSSHPPHHRSRRPPFELTEEEKHVLVECRRNSTVRGVSLGVASTLVLRWFVQQGRVPKHIQRRSWFYYGGLFMGSFFVGMASYKQRCLDKIMSLENSRLADELREHLAKEYSNWQEEVKTDPSAGGGNVQGHRRKHRGPSHHYPPPSTPAPSSSYPSISTYNEDRRGVEDRTISGRPSELQQQPSSDQPDAFGANLQEPYSADQGGWGQQVTTPTQIRGRTFDEIREESRRQQLQKNFPRVGRGEREEVYVEKGDWKQRERPQGSGRPVRRNKYGDIIEE